MFTGRGGRLPLIVLLCPHCELTLVSLTTATQSEAIVPESNHREEIADFVRWALAQLELSWDETDGRGRLPLGEADRAAFAGRSELQLAFEPSPLDSSSDSSGDSIVEPIDLDSRFGNWLVKRLRAVGPAVHVRPSDQPMAVNDVASRLFAAYRVEGGQIHLGGCQLTDLAFLRLSFAASESGRPCIRHVFVSHDGTSVPDELANRLGLLEVEPILKFPPRIDDGALNALIAAGRRIAAKSSSSRDPSATTVEPLVLAVVWIKHASGKLQFTVGETTVEVPFSDWARLVEAPPYVAEHSGASSFHLAATDDGRIDVFDQIASCEHSGRRVLVAELVACCVTGKRVLEEFTELCPVSGNHALIEQFATCSVCRQRVSNVVLINEICDACRQLSKIKIDDPRLVWILGEHPGLDRWSRWRLAETADVYIAQAERLMKRLLVVVDKETLSVRQLATGGRFSASWTPISGDERAEILK
ncbi:MAG: hypothetical protein IH898_02490 [Planctomycetes bacterium]|nr:hypothetical protein [Planctomycetota bacterium]